MFKNVSYQTYDFKPIWFLCRSNLLLCCEGIIFKLFCIHRINPGNLVKKWKNRWTKTALDPPKNLSISSQKISPKIILRRTLRRSPLHPCSASILIKKAYENMWTFTCNNDIGRNKCSPTLYIPIFAIHSEVYRCHPRVVSFRADVVSMTEGHIFVGVDWGPPAC